MVSQSHEFEQDNVIVEWVIEVSSPHGGQEREREYKALKIRSSKGMSHTDFLSIRRHLLKVPEPLKIVASIGT